MRNTPFRSAILGLSLLLPLAVGCSPGGRSSGALAGHPLKRTGEQPVIDELGRHGRILLHARRFDDLETMADSLERSDPHWPSGRSVALSFYQATFGSADSNGPDAWNDHLASIREWADARHESAIPRLALAEALIGRAWAARGTGWAREVPTSHMNRFADDMAEARSILDQCPEEVKGGREWFGAMLRALHGIGDDEEYRKVADRALQLFPAEPRFYTGYAGHLLPRWYGVKGEWEAFAERSTSALPDSIADEFYARMVENDADATDTLFAPYGLLSWPRTRAGCERWHRRWPSSTEPLSSLAHLAWRDGDRVTAHQAFLALGDTCDVDVWELEENYWTARRWSEK